MLYKKIITKHLQNFCRNEQGVYSVFMAGIGFVLLGIIALSVDGSGILLDKARLSQGMEQGALAVSAEANRVRSDELTKHQYFNNQQDTVSTITDEAFKELCKDKNQFQCAKVAKAYNRDQQLLKSYVQAYLPDVKIPRDFDYECETKQHSSQRVVSCWAQGDIDRPSWLPLNGTSLTFPPQVTMASEQVFTGKILDAIAPIDLMLVTDLSGSMNDNNASGGDSKSKIQVLREVVADIGKELLDTNSADVSPYNRIRFASFAFGASQVGNQRECVLPYILTRSGNTELFRRTSYYHNYYVYNSYHRRYYQPLEYTGSLLDYWNYKISRGEGTTEYGRFLSLLNEQINYPQTIEDIYNFNGRARNYEISFPKNSWCLASNNYATTTTSEKWYKKNEGNQLNSALSQIMPLGATLSSSGLLVGANLLMDKNMEEKAQPSKLQTNTQRILLILSDGRDEIYGDKNTMAAYKIPEMEITRKLLDQGACKAIRIQVDKLQDKNHPSRPTRIHFVAFGYSLDGEQKQSWENCVGKENYHSARNKKELLDTFKQIVGRQEDVGHVAPHKVF